MKPTARPSSAALLWLNALVLGGGVLLALGVVVALLGFAIYEREETETEALHRGELLARVLEDHVTRNVDAASLVLASLAETLNLQADASPERLQPVLAQALTGLPSLRSVAVLDGAGRVLASTSGADTGAVLPLALLQPWPAPGKDRLLALQSGRGLRDLGRPDSAAAARGVFQLPMLRRLDTPDGLPRFLLAVINPEALAAFQDAALSEVSGAALLSSYDGQLLSASHGLVQSPGALLRGHPVFRQWLPQQEHGSYLGEGAMPGRQLVAFRVSRNRPLLVIVEQDHEAVLAQWRQSLRGLAAAGVAVVLLIAAVTGLAWRSVRAREAARQALQRQLSFTARLQEISPLPMALYDGDGRYLMLNQAWEQWLGRPREQLLGTPVLLWAEHSAQTRQMRQQDLVLLTEGTPHHDEVQLLDAQGQVRDVVMNRVPVPDGAGVNASVLCVLMDVSSFRAAERATREARDAAQEASRTKSEFISNISHELRTPLQTILGFSELGQVRASESAKLAAMFGEIHSAGQRMLGLVNDLLDVSRIESDAGTFMLERVDLRVLVRDVLQELQPAMVQRRLLPMLKLSEQALDCRVDVQRMRQVLHHVLGNALRYSPEGGVVEVEVQRLDRERVGLSVADQGPGIPPAELHRIFDAFVQSSATKDGSGGRGLGLAISRKIMAIHQGAIHAANRPEGGAVLHLELPSKVSLDMPTPATLA